MNKRKKKEEKRFLTEIQKMLLQEKVEKLQIAMATLEQRKGELSRVITLCSRELQIPDDETWSLSDNFEYFIKQDGGKNGSTD